MHDDMKKTDPNFKKNNHYFFLCNGGGGGRDKFFGFLGNRQAFQVVVELDHGSFKVRRPDFDLVQVAPVEQVGGTAFLGLLLHVHGRISEEGDHVDAFRNGKMHPPHGGIQAGRAVNVLKGHPFHAIGLEGCDPLVVVAGVLLIPVGSHCDLRETNIRMGRKRMRTFCCVQDLS